jgi:hypothetical protein
VFIPTVASTVVGSVLETDETIVEDDRFKSDDDGDGGDAGKNSSEVILEEQDTDVCE